MAGFWIVAVLTLFTACGFAAPVVEARGAVDAQLLATFSLMEQYASASYCDNNHNSPGDKITCASKNCPTVQSANTTTLIEFESDLNTDVTGYVSVDETNRLLVVSFRGSNTIENWLTNLLFDMVSSDICKGCTVHHGFWQSWVDSRDDVLSCIKRASNTHPGYKLVVTGHSLGGAIASLAAAQLRNEGYQAALYTFGSPRIAGSKLSDYITNQPGGNYRVTHWNDPVPRLPPLALQYVHISPEYYINKANLKSVSPADIKVFHGNVNYQGNTAWLITDIGAHLWYFNSITQCAIDKIFG